MLMIYFLFTFVSPIIYSMHISLAYMYILLFFVVLNQENRLIVIQICQHSQKMKCYINTPCIIQIGKQLYFPSILAGLIFFFLKNIYKVQFIALLPFIRDWFLSTKIQQATQWTLAFLYLLRRQIKLFFLSCQQLFRFLFLEVLWLLSLS